MARYNIHAAILKSSNKNNLRVHGDLKTSSLSRGSNQILTSLAVNRKYITFNFLVFSL